MLHLCVGVHLHTGTELAELCPELGEGLIRCLFKGGELVEGLARAIMFSEVLFHLAKALIYRQEGVQDNKALTRNTGLDEVVSFVLSTSQEVLKLSLFGSVLLVSVELGIYVANLFIVL